MSDRLGVRNRISQRLHCSWCFFVICVSVSDANTGERGNLLWERLCFVRATDGSFCMESAVSSSRTSSLRKGRHEKGLHNNRNFPAATQKIFLSLSSQATTHPAKRNPEGSNETWQHISHFERLLRTELVGRPLASEPQKTLVSRFPRCWRSSRAAHAVAMFSFSWTNPLSHFGKCDAFGFSTPPPCITASQNIQSKGEAKTISAKQVYHSLPHHKKTLSWNWTPVEAKVRVHRPKAVQFWTLCKIKLVGIDVSKRNFIKRRRNHLLEKKSSSHIRFQVPFHWGEWGRLSTLD